MRCRNEDEYIVASIASVYRLFDEIIVILNNSTDRTRELVEDLMTDRPNIRLLRYDEECAAAGPGYWRAVEEAPKRSLARFYNWCLEQTKYRHVCKWDGDMIALPAFARVRDLIGSHDVVAFDGYDVLDRETTSVEPRIFRYDAAHTRYEDWELYEVLKHEYRSMYVLEEKCFLHMKLVKREWLHRNWVSPNEFATGSAPPPSTREARGDGGADLRSGFRRVLRRLLRTY